MSLPVRLQKTVYRGNVDSFYVFTDGDVTLRKLTLIGKKDTKSTSTIILTRKNTVAGGSDSEITATYLSDIKKTKIQVLLTSDNTNLINYNKVYFDLESEDASDDTDVETIARGKLVILQNVNNTPTFAQPVGVVGLPILKKYIYIKIINEVVTQFNYYGFDSAPTYSLDSGTLTLLSNSNELDKAGKFESSNQDYASDPAEITLGRLPIVFGGSIADLTIVCTWELYDTSVFSSVGSDVVPESGGGSTTIILEDMPHGTTAERIAYGATLSATDRKWFFDDDDNTAYVWNGTEWK